MKLSSWQSILYLVAHIRQVKFWGILSKKSLSYTVVLLQFGCSSGLQKRFMPCMILILCTTTIPTVRNLVYSMISACPDVSCDCFHLLFWLCRPGSKPSENLILRKISGVPNTVQVCRPTKLDWLNDTVVKRQTTFTKGITTIQPNSSSFVVIAVL